jgi:hypothetical protein
MHLTELKALIEWSDRELANRQLLPLYQTLHALLQHNAQPNQHKQPIETQKNALQNALLSINLAQLSNEQISFLKRLKIFPHIGEIGAEEVDSILFRNSLDIATAVARIGEAIGELSGGFTKLSQLREGLAGCVDSEDPHRNEIALRVRFAGDAGINNIVELKAWGTLWHDIGRGIAMVNGSAPEDVRVIGASDGSIIFVLASTYGIVKTMSLIVLEVLKLAERVLDVRKKAEEVRALKLSNEQIAQALESEAQKLAEAETSAISDRVLAQINGSSTQMVDGEQRAALAKSVTNLLRFTTRGGSIDFVSPPDEELENGSHDDTKDVRKELRATFEQIRILEKNVEGIQFLQSAANDSDP